MSQEIKKSSVSNSGSAGSENPAPYYLFFDTETTGLPKDWNAPASNYKNWPRLVQLAWLVYSKDGVLLAEGEKIIKPEGFKIPAEVLKVHRITNEHALEAGVKITDVLSEFEKLCESAHVFVAHNMNFDSKVIGAEFHRHFSRDPLAKKKQICTMLGSKDFCKIKGQYGYKWPGLSELHRKLFKDDFENSHDAMADIKATAKCFWKLRELKVL